MCDHTKSLSFVLVCILAICSPSILLADTDADVSVAVGQEFTVMLHDIDGVYGFWSLASSLPSWLVLIDQTWVADDPTVIGGPGTAHFTFRGTGPGNTTLTFEYKYPGQDTALAMATCQVTVGTPADTEKIFIAVGEQFTVALDFYVASGQAWYLESPLPSWLALVGNEQVTDPLPPGHVGGTGTEYWTFRASGPGSTTLTFEYRPYQGGTPTKVHLCEVTAGTAADPSLVLYLPFDEGAGAIANDLSSHQNPGTIVGATWAPGVRGTSLEFGLGSHVIIPEIPAYDVTDAVSLLAWVKTTRDTFGGRVIDKSLYPTSGFDLCLTLNAGLPRLEFFVNNTSAVNGTTAVIDDEWHFIGGTFGDKTLRMYVDGNKEAEAQSVGSVDINPNDWPIMVGGETSSNGGQQYLGSIDEVAMYNRELSADEVMAIFQNGVLSTCQPEVTSVRIVRLQPVGDHFEEVGEVSTVAVGDYFTIKVQVTNRGTTPVPRPLSYEATLSGQGDADVVGDYPRCLGLAMPPLQPGESVTLEPFCWGKAFQATAAGPVTMDIGIDTCHQPFRFEIQPEATPACQPEVTSVRIVELQLVGGDFVEVGEVSEVAVGDFFTIEVDVTNRGSTPVSVMNLYGWAFSGQGHAEVVQAQLMFCAAMPELQPGESMTLRPFCAGKAFEATTAGWATMDFTVGDCRRTFHFEIQPEATPACQPEVTSVRIVELQLVGDHFVEVGEVSEVAVGDYFTIEIDVINRGNTPVTMTGQYQWSLSGQGHADYIDNFCIGVYWYDLQPGESTTLRPFLGCDALLATTAGPITMDMTVGENDCQYSFDFEILDGAGAIVFEEDFDDGDYNGWQIVDQGNWSGPSDWSAATGAMVQSSNIYTEPTSDTRFLGTYAVSPQSFSRDQHVIALDMKASDDDWMGVMFCYQDQNNYYRFAWNGSAGGGRLVQVLNGTYISHDTCMVSYTPGRTYRVEIRLTTQAVRVYVDGSQVLFAFDDTLPGGSLALYCYANEGTHFDNIRVSEL